MESSLPSLSVFAGLWLMQVTVPGPNFVRISEAALAQSRAAAMNTATGTAAAHCLWCLIAIGGAAIIAQTPLLGGAVRLAGALYFAGYGCRLIYRAFRSRPIGSLNSTPLSAFSAGFTTAMASPHSGLFFASVLTAIFPPILDTRLVAGMIVVVITVSLGWYLIVTSLLAAPASRAWYQRRRSAIELAFGAIMLVASLKLLVSAWERMHNG